MVGGSKPSVGRRTLSPCHLFASHAPGGHTCPHALHRAGCTPLATHPVSTSQHWPSTHWQCVRGVPVCTVDTRGRVVHTVCSCSMHPGSTRMLQCFFAVVVATPTVVGGCSACCVRATVPPPPHKRARHSWHSTPAVPTCLTCACPTARHVCRRVGGRVGGGRRCPRLDSQHRRHTLGAGRGGNASRAQCASSSRSWPRLPTTCTPIGNPSSMP